MDVIEHKRLNNFFNNVMMHNGFYGWKLLLCGDSYCWQYKKLITVDKNYNGDLRQIILHEIAHINTAKYCNQKHNNEFWKTLELLTKKWLKCGLDDTQKKHKEYSTSGIYSLKYKNKLI